MVEVQVINKQAEDQKLFLWRNQTAAEKTLINTNIGGFPTLSGNRTSKSSVAQIRQKFVFHERGGIRAFRMVSSSAHMINQGPGPFLLVASASHGMLPSSAWRKLVHQHSVSIPALTMGKKEAESKQFLTATPFPVLLRYN